MAVSAQPTSLGVVRNNRQPKPMRISRGIRFLKADFEAAFKVLRPNEAVPNRTHCIARYCQHLFKISPTPAGANLTEVQEFLTANYTWLRGCDEEFEEVFSTWNNKVSLPKWIQPKVESKSCIIAGSPKLPKFKDGKVFRSDALPPLQGANIACTLCKWLQLLKRPQNISHDYSCRDDWGVSWVELFVSFLLSTGMHMPVGISGTAATSNFDNKYHVNARSKIQTFACFTGHYISESPFALKNFWGLNGFRNFSPTKMSL